MSAAMNSETNSDPLDVAVAVAQAMGQSNMEDTKPANDEMWQSFMNSSTAPSGFDALMDQPLFPLDQTSSIDPLDPASCLSLLNNTALPTSSSMAWPSEMAAEKQQWVHDIKLENEPQVKLEHPTTWPAASSSMLLQQPAAPQTSMTFGGAPSTSGMMLPPTPPVEQQTYGTDEIPWLGMHMNTSGSEPSPPASVENQPAVTMSLLSQQQQQQQQQQQLPAGSMKTSTSSRARRRSSESTRPYRRRTSSHPSVASVVSLTAHEPVAHLINGIEHITFLYSHDRLVKEYTVRTDVENCSLDDIPMEFRVLNAIYPRANVDREEYDGNRWDYETSCNTLGWKLCWLNQEQLCGRRGLIQRAVDSYRNRHANMRSRRVTRQEKVANGTLRRRRAKKN